MKAYMRHEGKGNALIMTQTQTKFVLAQMFTEKLIYICYDISVTLSSSHVSLVLTRVIPKSTSDWLVKINALS